jgi:hypothetical protein
MCFPAEKTISFFRNWVINISHAKYVFFCIYASFVLVIIVLHCLLGSFFFVLLRIV